MGKGDGDPDGGDQLTAVESGSTAGDSRPIAADSPPTVAVLFSGGKDSALAATLLDPFYDVVLCHCAFGVGTDPPVAETAATAASALDRPLATVALDESIAREAVDRMVADGYPRAGIQHVHEHALETVASRETLVTDGNPQETDALDGGSREPSAVADGTRRDDRVPSVDLSVAQSLEDRHGVDYVRPLLGYGRAAVDDLADRHLTVETGPSEAIPTADYETELRVLMAAEYGPETVADVFPDHVQSRVTGRV